MISGRNGDNEGRTRYEQEITKICQSEVSQIPPKAKLLCFRLKPHDISFQKNASFIRVVQHIHETAAGPSPQPRPRENASVTSHRRSRTKEIQVAAFIGPGRGAAWPGRRRWPQSRWQPVPARPGRAHSDCRGSLRVGKIMIRRVTTESESRPAGGSDS